MILNKYLTIKKFSKHKRRMDRGGFYWGYFQMLSTGAILVGVFNIKEWWVYLLGVILIVGFRYISGYIDEKRNILATEQDQYAMINPFNKRLLEEIQTLNNKLDVLLKNNS